MTRTVYLNGAYLPETEAKVSIFDRGFLMGDGVYEVTSVIAGKLIEFDAHMRRLTRSLNVLGMGNPLTEADWLNAHRHLVTINGIEDGLVYTQVTRGSEGDRNFSYPPEGTPQTVVMFTQRRRHLIDNPGAMTGLKAISLPDLRWGRRDIKSVQILYASMAKMEAKARGVQEVWFVEDGFVTEGSSNNTFIVKDGRIITRPLSNDILHGTTRASVIRLAQQAGFAVEERAFTLEEALAADEAFFSSAGDFVMPIVELDGVRIGTGSPGAVVARLREIYLRSAQDEAV